MLTCQGTLGNRNATKAQKKRQGFSCIRSSDNKSRTDKLSETTDSFPRGGKREKAAEKKGSVLKGIREGSAGRKSGGRRAGSRGAGEQSHFMESDY